MAIKRIYSAGGIVLRRSTTPLRHGFAGQASTKGIKSTKGIEVLVTQHSRHKGWDFPKGHIEIGESSETAALREVEEETGIKAEIIEKAGSTQYFYWAPSSTSSSAKAPDDKKVTEGKEKVFKTVTFFLMKFIDQGKATTGFEVSAHKWLAPDEIEAQLTFKDTKEMWEKVKGRIVNSKW